MALTTEPVVSGRRAFRTFFTRTAPPARELASPTGTFQVEEVAEVADAAGRGKRHGWGRRYSARLLVTDFLALLAASILVHLIRFPAVTGDGSIAQIYVPYVALTAVLLVVWMLALTWSGSRDHKTIGYGATEYKRIMHATFAVFGAAAIASYLFTLELPRVTT